MTLNDLLEQIKSQGICPICVESLSENSNDKLTFSGTLDEYLDAVKLLRRDAAKARCPLTLR